MRRMMIMRLLYKKIAYHFMNMVRKVINKQLVRLFTPLVLQVQYAPLSTHLASDW